MKKIKLDCFVSIITVNHFGKKRPREITLGPLSSFDMTLNRKPLVIERGRVEPIAPSQYPVEIKIEAVYGGAK